ncbi:hypothetical protein C0J52_16792 [Blattella germanica]|nr:hypothetical protein C0J52_16792 [Blattella germanica]
MKFNILVNCIIHYYRMGVKQLERLKDCQYKMERRVLNLKGERQDILHGAAEKIGHERLNTSRTTAEVDLGWKHCKVSSEQMDLYKIMRDLRVGKRSRGRSRPNGWKNLRGQSGEIGNE